jgi:hypothetical protein
VLDSVSGLEGDLVKEEKVNESVLFPEEKYSK